jgi:hypothetical protein
MTNEFSFWHVVDRVVKQRIRSNARGASYVYRFDANTPNNCFRALNGVDQRWHRHQRAIHMDDLCYLFKPSFVPVPERNTDGFDTITRMVKNINLKFIN